MTDLMVGNYHLFLVGKYRILLLIACDNDLDALLHVLLRRGFSARADRTERRLVYYIGKLGSGCTGRHARDVRIIDIRLGFYLLGVNAEYFFSALQVGKLYRNAAVKAAGTCKSGIKHLGAVGRCKNDNARVALKAVHLSKELVERLLALIIAADPALALLTDSIYLVYEDDAGGFFLCLAEQVAHL